MDTIVHGCDSVGGELKKWNKSVIADEVGDEWSH